MKRIFLTIAGLLLVMSATVLAAEKPNVIFIAVDDLNDWEGYMGNSQIITPNMDALASQGTFFKSAHCQYAVCGPSRASVMSGMYYHSLGFGVDGALQQKDDAVYDAVKKKGSSLIYEYFADHGYKTMAAGKLLHHHVPEETVDVSHGRGPWDFNRDENGNQKRMNWFGSKGLLDWGPINKPENEMSDYKAAEWAVDQLSQDHDKPFFLMTGFLRPHTPLHIQQKYLDMYPLDEIELPPYKADDYDDIPKAARETWNSYPTTSWAIENNQWRKMLQAYMGCITFTDVQIGKILEALENSPYKDNTIVVLWSDHGFHIGEKERFQKHTAWDRSTKVPMIIMDPRTGPTQGSTKPVEANVQLIDLYPTLLDLCGLPANKAVEGRSLVPLIENPDIEWEYPAYTFRRETYATVKYGSYRFIEYFDGSMELYNHANDPNEWNNLADNDKYKDVIERMHGMLQEPHAKLGYEESKRR
ncbi:sulfatase [uncultured Draconibacterium sp.]|uniref:sulfatase n=1 Tax=uncultured Draconibacterium sp. TaxID=1573823 RepID=UPI0025FBF574|nr:sulfatase [uncultured Draconibacterium sp.]